MGQSKAVCRGTATWGEGNLRESWEKLLWKNTGRGSQAGEFS